MKIWIDADACPTVIKDILYKAAEREAISLTLVANRPLRVPPSPFVSFIQVSSGMDIADSRIVEELEAGDLVITGDIPLAAKVVEKGGSALNPRGEFYTAENIRERLNTRDFLDDLRSSGIETGGPPPLTHRNRQAFANHLDTFLRRNTNKC